MVKEFNKFILRFSSCKPGENQPTESVGSSCSEMEASPSPQPQQPRQEHPQEQPSSPTQTSDQDQEMSGSNSGNVETASLEHDVTNCLPGETGSQIGN